MSNITAKQFVDEALKWLGYYGKSAGEDLGTFEAEKVGKYTIFAEYFDDLFNAEGKPLNTLKNGYDWCAIFLLYIACQLAGNYEDGFKLLYQYWGDALDNCAAGVGFLRNYFGYHNRYGAEPKVGAIGILTDCTHVVCVESVNDDGTITSVEGNWSNCVCRVTRKQSDFDGFGYPDYAEEAEEPEPEEPEQEADDRDALIEELRKEKQSLLTTVANYSVQLSNATEAKETAELRAEKAEAELEAIKTALKLIGGYISE